VATIFVARGMVIGKRSLWVAEPSLCNESTRPDGDLTCVK
jgi:hypothetical protein